MSVYNRRNTTKGNRTVDHAKIRSSLGKLNPVVAATLKNVVAKNGDRPTGDENQNSKYINTQKLERLSNVISNNINAATDLRQITPYIDKAEIIWNTLLLYPNGLQDKILTYDTQNSLVKNAKLHSELLKLWDEYYTNDYKIEPELRKMTSDILWNTGSYVKLNLSRPALDYLINGSELTQVSGNEELRSMWTSALEKDFIKQGNEYRVRNKGCFIRNPDGGGQRLSGLEALFAGTEPTSEPEFQLFGKEDPENLIPITFTDNPAVLMLQQLNQRQHEANAHSVMGTESFASLIERNSAARLKADKKKEGPPAKEPKATTSNLNVAQAEALQNMLYPQRNVQQQQIQYLKPSDAYSIPAFGRGLVYHVPSEAVIPIHYNGNSRQKMDYIFLLDGDGNFLKNTNDFEFYQSPEQNKNSIANRNKAGSENHLIASLKKIQSGNDCDFDMSEFAEMAKNSIIKRFLSSVISNKGDSISIDLDEETNKIFLARIFKKQAVRCLYVPGEYVTYMAFKYNRMGTGQSLVQAAKMHIARLAAFDLADTLANLEAAQPHTLMTIRAEKEDVDPYASIAIARQAHFDSNPRLHNILSTAQLSVPQIVDALRESSLTIKVDPGENPHIIGPDIETTQMERGNFKPVDDNSRQEVLSKISNYFFLKKSWLDVADDDNNFQIEALAEHQMLLNQTVLWQEMLADGLADFMRKHFRVNEPLMTRFIETIQDNKKYWKPDSGQELKGSDTQIIDVIMTDFINNVFCTLPRPTSTESTAKLNDSLDAISQLTQKWEDMTAHGPLLDKVIKMFGIEKEDYSAEEIKQVVKSVFMAEAFRRYNLPMPFDDVVGDGKNGGIASLINQISTQRSNVTNFLVQYVLASSEDNVKLRKEYLKKLNKALEADQLPEPEPEVDPDAPTEDTSMTDPDNPEDVVDPDANTEDVVDPEENTEDIPEENPEDNPEENPEENPEDENDDLNLDDETK